MAVAFGIEADDRATFARVAHDNFEVIFPSADVTADHVIASLESLIKADPQLAKYAA